MATLLNCGGLFLHVPKTGGNWVSDVLEQQGIVLAHLGGKHVGRQQLAAFERLLETPRRYGRANHPLFKFCFVRHPLAWYESWYRMNAALGWPEWASDADAWNPSVELNGLGAPTFAGFIENVLQHQRGFVSRLYAYYADDCHFVGRQERLATDLEAVITFLTGACEPLTIANTAPVNVSERIDCTLDPSLRDQLDTSEREAYERFGYERERPRRGAAPDGLVDCGALTTLGSSFVHDTGFSYYTAIPELARFADSADHPDRSLLTITEDGVALRRAHAVHDDVRAIGRGCFSHWNDDLFFSTSDNTDPNCNGRRYELRWKAPLVGARTPGLSQAQAIVMAGAR